MNDDKTLVRNAPAQFALKNRQTGEIFEIHSKATVGRSDECNIRLDEGHVSRVHASLKISHDMLLLKDEGSENGTFVNGKKISEIVLRAGDKVKFDIHEFTVVPVEQNNKMDSGAETLVHFQPEQNQNVANETLIQPSTDHLEDDSEKTLIMTPTHQEDIAETLIMAAPAQTSVNETLVTKPTSELKQTRVQNNTAVLADWEEAYEFPEEDYAEDELTCIFGYHPLVFDKIFPLDKEVMVVGKSPRADIVLKDSSVSSEHAEIFWENGYWGIEDLNSTNGTFVNGQPLYEPCMLHAGDFLQFGLIQMVFAQPEPASYEPETSSSLKWIAIAGGVITLLVLAIGGFVLSR